MEYKIYNGYSYRELMEKFGDPRVEHFPLMSSPFPTVFICLIYVMLVTKIGPSYMATRSPFKLKSWLILYNLIQVIWSMWAFFKAGRMGWFGKYSYRCQPVDYSSDPEAAEIVNFLWWFLLSQFTEFFDTFFFVLRKKQQHVSALHVFHHAIMLISIWIIVKFIPGGHGTFGGLVNAFVHTFMYFYYMLSAMGPRFAQFLWWKKYMTWLQMVQFVVAALHAFQILFSDCDFPHVFAWWIGTQGLVFLALFANFYRQAYWKKMLVKEEDGSGEQSYRRTSFHQSENGLPSCDVQSIKLSGNSNHTSNGNSNGESKKLI